VDEEGRRASVTPRLLISDLKIAAGEEEEEGDEEGERPRVSKISTTPFSKENPIFV